MSHFDSIHACKHRSVIVDFKLFSYYITQGTNKEFCTMLLAYTIESESGNQNDIILWYFLDDAQCMTL